MNNKKIPVKVMVKDESVLVSCAGGGWYEVPSNNPWLWVLGAVCYPEEYDLQIQDHREHREPQQHKLSTDHPDE